MNETSTATPKYAGLFKRLFAILYDVFLLTAILIIFAAIMMTLNHGKPIETSSHFRPLYIIFMFSVCYFYFAWFWIHGGQTLGMKTWQIKLQADTTENNNFIDWKVAAIRFFCAIVSWSIFGLGYLWIFFDKKNRSWHDQLSKTVIIDLRRKN